VGMGTSATLPVKGHSGQIRGSRNEVPGEASRMAQERSALRGGHLIPPPAGAGRSVAARCLSDDFCRDDITHAYSAAWAVHPPAPTLSGDPPERSVGIMEPRGRGI